MGIRDRLPRRVTIVEVSPRDGLQTEERICGELGRETPGRVARARAAPPA